MHNAQRPTPQGARIDARGPSSGALRAAFAEATAPRRSLGGGGSWALGVGSLFACLRQQTAKNDQQALLTVAADFSPRVMRVSGTEIIVDVSGLERLIGEPPAILGELTHALRDAGIAGAAAIGATQTLARLRAACGHSSAAIAALPVALLQPLETLPHGINDRDRVRPYDIFEKWGIATLGDLAALPADALASRLGRRGTALQRLARGEDLCPFVPDADIPRYVERLELEWPIETLEPLSFVLPRVLDSLSAALERADRGAAAIRLELRLTDRSTHVRLLQLPSAIRDARVLRTLLLLDLESAPPAAAIDVITIEIDPAPARITQFSLLTRALPSPETLSTLTARLSALVGASRVGSPALADSHRADAWVIGRYAPASAASPLRRDRPGGLLEPVLRRRRPPVAIRVSVTRGQPVHVASSRCGVPCGAVDHAAGPWRTSGEWWTQGTDARRAEGIGHCTAATHTYWNRDEWDVALKSGAVCRIYQDRTTDRWFLEGVYD